MAELIGLKERQLALADINSKLKELELINKFLEAENPSGIYKISFDKFRIPVHCPDGAVIKNIVLAQKKQLASQVRELAKLHSIEFNEADELILGSEF